MIRLMFRLGGQSAARWRRLARRRSLLAADCAGLAIERGERVLSSCGDGDGGYALVATDRALYRRTGPGCWSRLGWERVAAVAWDGTAGEPGRLILTVLSGAAPARLVVPVRERGVLPELAAERMRHAYLGRWTVPLGDGQHLLVEARRPPGTGKLLWVILPDGTGRGPGDGDERGRVDLALACLATEFGITYRPRSCDTARGAE